MCFSLHDDLTKNKKRVLFIKIGEITFINSGKNNKLLIIFIYLKCEKGELLLENTSISHKGLDTDKSIQDTCNYLF